jgi:molybdopterin-synthase adenylyltransferase
MTKVHKDITDKQLERYARHIIMDEVGDLGQQKLLAAKVLVIGAGGLGSAMLTYLAAAGVGTIGVIDNDVVDLSNLQRQIIHTTDDIGKNKAQNAAKRMLAINPDITVNIYSERLNADNAATIIAPYDIVADGCDNFATRLLVSDTAVTLKKTLVSAALGRFDGQLATFAPHLGTADNPLPCYRCFMPADPGPNAQRSCSDVGVLGPVAGIIGTMQATEVVKLIMGIGGSLVGKILIFDALDMRSRVIALPADPACPICRH